jgi:hypothetical protein
LDAEHLLLSSDDVLLAATSTHNLPALQYAIARAPDLKMMELELMLACADASNASTTDQCAIVEALLEAGVQPTQSAAWAACRAGNERAVQALMHHGYKFTNLERNICIRHGHGGMGDKATGRKDWH